MKTEGTLTLDGKAMTVEGTSWMDHEFGSNQLQEYQVGWDWFSIQLDNMTELMIYLIRHRDGKPDPHSSGTLTYPDGTSTHLRLEELDVRMPATWKSRKTGTRYPAKWKIRIPQWNIDLTVTPAVSDQELVTHESTRVTYWEGSVRVKGLVEGKPVSGVGYVELTGYDKPLDQKI
jgi:predicted secreted hydrolase